LEAEAPKQTAEILRPYVPRLTIRWLAECPDATYRVVEGSMVFVDISGFTKMSERLARHGKVGAEEVTDVLDAVFAKLLSVAYGEDGSLLKFGGDALLLWFVGEGHAIRAATAAHGMRATLRSIGKLDTTAGKVVLRMSVGVNSGDFQFFLVGESHRELIVTGPAASRTVDMESTATAGEILVSADTAAALPSKALGQPKGEGILLRSGPSALAFSKDQIEIPIGSIDIAGCIPLSLREHLLSGVTEAEHRTATVAFVHFDGVDGLMAERGPDVVADGLQELVAIVQRAVENNGVTFLGSDIDHDGGKIILTAGVPLAHGDDEGRMLLTLRTVLDAETAIPVRIGVNRGPVFTGNIGPPYRRTYTVMGDAVNLAARVMSMAVASQILSTGPVLDTSSVAFNALALEPFMVKGKKDPVHAYMVGHATGSKPESSVFEFPLIGRDAEMDTFRRALLELREDRGSLIELVGNAGMGKTRLLNEFRAEATDLPQLMSACELYESSVPYLPIRRLLRLLLGHTHGQDATAAAARLEEDVRGRAPELLPWLPLLGIVADLPVPMTPEVSDLDEEFRKAKLEEVTTEYLARVITEPTLVVIEDAHWMDAGSSDLLRVIAGRISELPWLICVSRRDEETGFVMTEAARCTSLRLTPLGDDALGELIGIATEDAPFPPHAVHELSDRSGGNPLFLQELVQSARTAGTVEGLPDSIDGMVTAEIDRLDPTDRRVLRYASVLGVSFDGLLLTALLEAEHAPIGRTAFPRLVQFIHDEGNGRYRFRHALMRDSAYEGLPYRTRKKLHARAGTAILAAAGDDDHEQAELLSMHFFLAGEFERAFRYSTIAAERAEGSYANVEASRFLRRAIDAGRRWNLEAEEFVRLNERLGDVLERAGLYDEAGRAYAEARRSGALDPLAESGLILKQAKLADQAGSPVSSLRWLTRALHMLKGAGGSAVQAQRARLSATYSAVRAGQGRADEAIRWADRAISEAGDVGASEALANAHYMIAWTKVNQGELGQAAHFEQALSLFERLGDVKRQGDVLTYYGAMAYWEGRWDDALVLYERGRERSERAGDVVGAAIASMNIAEVRSDQGRLDEAEGPARDALRVFRSAAYPELIATDCGILGRIVSRAGRHEEAEGILSEALEQAERSGAHLIEVGTLGVLAEDRVRFGDAEGAFAYLDRADTRASAVGGAGVYEPLLERVRGCAHVVLGELEDADKALDRSLDAARSAGSEFEVMLSLSARIVLAHVRANPPVPEDLAETESIAERLGIDSVPPMMPAVMSV
jgi:class 3 adenylate cyclase/tetratricopeptide (TPR) repeat protein